MGGLIVNSVGGCDVVVATIEMDHVCQAEGEETNGRKKRSVNG